MTKITIPGLIRSGNWNEYNLNPLTRINWRASLVPAAAVIPAPRAYIKVVAVKKLVVDFWYDAPGPRPLRLVSAGVRYHPSRKQACPLLGWACDPGSFTLKKLECLKQAFAMNTLAWNNNLGLRFYFVGFYN